jgi:hypothetical protein
MTEKQARRRYSHSAATMDAHRRPGTHTSETASAITRNYSRTRRILRSKCRIPFTLLPGTRAVLSDGL